MRILFVTDGGIKNFASLEKCEEEILFFPFEEGLIDYEEELSGKTNLFESVAALSKRASSIVVCGAKTRAYGQVRNSAIVAQKGKILGVADATRACGDEVGCGTPLKLFDTEQGKIGLIVADDVYFQETSRSLCDCGAQLLLCPFHRQITTTERVLVRATAFFCGTPVACCGKGSAVVANGRAEECFYSPFSPVAYAVDTGARYHLIQTRRRGFFPEFT